MLTMTNKRLHDNMHSPLNLAPHYLTDSHYLAGCVKSRSDWRTITKITKASTEPNLARELVRPHCRLILAS